MKQYRLLKNRHVISLAVVICLFVFFMLWYTKIHPLAILHVDDWTYISYRRPPFPMRMAWNPTRVFPEEYMPLMGNIAAFALYPITGDYLQAVTLSLGVGTSLIVVLYFECFRRFLIKRTGISDIESILPTLFFILLHFAIFMSNDQQNKYLLGAETPTIIYYYMLPDLLNFSVIFILASGDGIGGLRKVRRAIRMGLILIMIYFAVFSNLFCSIILAAYSAVKLLSALFSDKKSVVESLKQNSLYCLSLLMWAASLLLEFKGGRARHLINDSTVTERIRQNAGLVFDHGLLAVNTVNIICLLICAAVVAGTIIYISHNKSRHEESKADESVLRVGLTAAMCTAAAFVFLFLLSAISRPVLFGMPLVWNAFLPWLFITAAVSLCCLQKRSGKALLLTPLLLCVLIVICGRHSGSLLESTAHHLPPATCVALNRFMMDQIYEAEEKGQTEMQLLVLVANRENALSFSAPFHGQRIMRTMLRHHLIHSWIDVEMKSSYEVNELFRLDEELQPMDAEARSA